jgi:predicted RNase H-like HicB family nuclease
LDVKREFTVVIERDEDGFFVGTVPQIKGCHTQAKSLDELMERMKEAVSLCLEVEGKLEGELQFVGVQRIAV